MMKIKYHISGTTNIQSCTISQRALSLLNKPGYVIVEKTSKAIEFKHNIWRIGSRMEAYGRVDGGRFEMNIEGKETVVNFDYYVSLVFWILFLGFFSFFALTKDIHILYFIPGILVLFYFKVENVKATAKGMMKRMLEADRYRLGEGSVGSK